MRLIDSREIEFEEVLSIYHTYHGHQNEYEERILKAANLFFGSWKQVSIPLDEIGKLVLPFHIERESRRLVIPPQGEILEEAYQRLLVVGKKDYETKNPFCFGKVMFQKKRIIEEGPGTFFFSLGPFTTFSITYQQIEEQENSLVHLDGLHRLLAIMGMPIEKKPKIIKVCVAYKK